MNPYCKVVFDYLIKRSPPPCLLSGRVAMETSGQAPKGAGLEPITVAGEGREPTTGCWTAGPVHRTDPQKLVSKKQLVQRDRICIFMSDAHFRAGLSCVAAQSPTPTLAQLSPRALFGAF